MMGRGLGGGTSGLVVGVALLVAACGGSGGASGSSDGERVDRNERESPLTEFFGSMDEASNEQYAEQARRVEAEVATCMEAQGFEYTPMETDFTEADEGPWSLPDKEFAEKYGFGMFTIDHEELAATGEDPNQERIEAMSEAERTAYESALWGEYDDETGEVVGSGGCQGEAWEAESGGLDESEFEGLWEEMDAVYQRIEGDSRVKDAARDWSSCMADAGYPDLDDPNAATDLVQSHYDDMNPEVEEDPEPLSEDEAISDTEAATMTSDDYGLEQADLEELRAYEIEVAVADYECRADYDDVYFEVQTESEEEFVEDNREELERYRDAYSATGSG